ncbi:MAG: hypothetical protein A3K77_06410 [Euryarchaeota archaeon RBG_13_31_8]|nr:MAG: hypothetical protein A3K77_06410 [Euryarchaeota archaeon RBG_13_31_8]
MNNLLTIKKDTIYIATDILAKELERHHKIIYNLVNVYKKEIETLGVLHFENVPNSGEKGGGTKKIYYLNKKQYIFLITNMRTKANEKTTVMKAKLDIADMFVEMEKALLKIHVNRQNEEWLATRKNGKVARKEFTDALKKLLEMTKETEPESTYVKKPKFMYSNFTRMIYKNLFDMATKIKSPRDFMTESQLLTNGATELACAKEIYKALNENKDAKEIYELINSKMKEYVKLGGKSTIIDLISGKQISMLEEEK